MRRAFDNDVGYVMSIVDMMEQH